MSSSPGSPWRVSAITALVTLSLVVVAAVARGGKLDIISGCGFLTRCPQPEDVLPPAARDAWGRSEQALQTLAKNMPVLAVPKAGSAFDLGALSKFTASERHGADDRRYLPRATNGHVAPDGPLARIVPVKGIEYKSETDFRSSPYPVAIIYLDSTVATTAYPELGLMAGTNYWIVQHADSGWVGWIQPATPGTPAHSIASTAPASYDATAPVLAARFVWDDSVHVLWSRVNGVCRMAAIVFPH